MIVRWDLRIRLHCCYRYMIAPRFPSASWDLQDNAAAGCQCRKQDGEHGIRRCKTRKTFIKISREQALREVYDEARRLQVEIRSGGEAEAYLDWAAQVQGIALERLQAVSIGDVIMVRQTHTANVRILREELIHIRQQRVGIEVSREAITTGELMARYELIRNRHQWGLTPEEIREVVDEIRQIRRIGRY